MFLCDFIHTGQFAIDVYQVSAGCFGPLTLLTLYGCIFIVDCYHFSLLTLRVCISPFMPKLSSLLGHDMLLLSHIFTHVHTYLKLTKSLLSLLQTPQSQVRVWVWWTGTKWSLMLSPGGRAPLLKLSLTTKCKVQRKIHFRRVGASSFMKLFPLVLSEELEKEIEKMDKNWVL